MARDLFEEAGLSPVERVELTFPPGKKKEAEEAEGKLMGKVVRGKTSAEALKEVGGETIGRDLFAESGITMKATPPAPAKVTRPYSPKAWAEAQDKFINTYIRPYVKETVGNIPKSAVEVARGIEGLGKVALDPLPTLKGMGQLVTGGVEAGARALPGSQFTGPKRPEERAFEETVSKPVGKFFEEPTKIPGKAAEYVKEKPVEAFLNVLPFTGYAKAAMTPGSVRVAREIENVVTKGFTKGLGAMPKKAETIGKIKSYFRKAADTTTDIVKNKDTLKYVDEAGIETSGHLPRSVSEHVQAYTQRMSDIYRKYHSAAVEAGKLLPQGESLKPIADELTKISQDPVLLKESPSAAAYAKAKAERYMPSQGTPTGLLNAKGQPIMNPPVPARYSPEQFEEAIKMYNESLAAWQKNPSYTMAKRAAIDGEVARMMRKQLDDMIMSATGKEYQDLKNLYGAYKESEKDLVNRFKKMASQTGARELVNVTDIYSIGEILTGLATAHPLMVAKGTAFAAAKKTMQAYWSPDRYVKNMFERVEDIMRGAEGSIKKTAKLIPPLSLAQTVKRGIPTDEELEAKIKKWVEEDQAKKKEKE